MDPHIKCMRAHGGSPLWMTDDLSNRTAHLTGSRCADGQTQGQGVSHGNPIKTGCLPLNLQAPVTVRGARVNITDTIPVHTHQSPSAAPDVLSV